MIKQKSLGKGWMVQYGTMRRTFGIGIDFGDYGLEVKLFFMYFGVYRWA